MITWAIALANAVEGAQEWWDSLDLGFESIGDLYPYG